MCDDELELQVDQTQYFMGEVEDGWWWGRIGGRLGAFPSNFVEMVSDNPEEVTKARDKMDRCRILFSYQPVHDDDLELQVDQTLDFMREVEDGWCNGI